MIDLLLLHSWSKLCFPLLLSIWVLDFRNVVFWGCCLIWETFITFLLFMTYLMMIFLYNIMELDSLIVYVISVFFEGSFLFWIYIVHVMGKHQVVLRRSWSHGPIGFPWPTRSAVQGKVLVWDTWIISQVSRTIKCFLGCSQRCEVTMMHQELNWTMHSL